LVLTAAETDTFASVVLRASHLHSLHSWWDGPAVYEFHCERPVWFLLTQHWLAAKRVGITKRIGWHTFRHTYTTLLHANGEDVKVVQELLRHGSARITMDVYAQAMTPAKRRAQGKVVAMLRDTEKKSS
jgi:integrase